MFDPIPSGSSDPTVITAVAVDYIPKAQGRYFEETEVISIIVDLSPPVAGLRFPGDSTIQSVQFTTANSIERRGESRFLIVPR